MALAVESGLPVHYPFLADTGAHSLLATLGNHGSQENFSPDSAVVMGGNHENDYQFGELGGLKKRIRLPLRPLCTVWKRNCFGSVKSLVELWKWDEQAG